MVSPLILAGVAMLGVVALGGKKRVSASGGGGPASAQKTGPNSALINPVAAMDAIDLPRDDWPLMVFDIPFAAGISRPLWPLVTNHSKKYVVSYRTIAGQNVGSGGRRFMATRGEGKYHVGIDLYANNGDPVLATEDGVIVNIYEFFHGSYAMFVQCDSGLVINYGEIAYGSWKEFGLSKGSRVKRGHGIARIGKMSGGSSMCHFEAYMPPSNRNEKYHGGETGPILNPTYYLLLAKFNEDAAGRAFSGANCTAIGSRNRPVPAVFAEIAAEEALVGERAEDSVLTELLIDGMYRTGRDTADGP